MKKYRFITEKQIKEYQGSTLKIIDGQDIIMQTSSPDAETLALFRYYDVDKTEERPEEREGYMIEAYYTNENPIRRRWRYVEIPEVEE